MTVFINFFFTFYCLAHTQETLQTHYCPCDSCLWDSLCFSVFNMYESFSSITFDIKLFLCQQKLLFWLVLLQLAYLRGRLMDTWKFAHCSKILSRCKVNSALAMLLDCHILSVGIRSLRSMVTLFQVTLFHPLVTSFHWRVTSFQSIVSSFQGEN